MSKPNLMLGSSCGVQKETNLGVKQALTASSHFLDLLSLNPQYNPVKHEAPAMMGTREFHKDFEQVSHNDGRVDMSFRARQSYLDDMLLAIFGQISGGLYMPIRDNAELDGFTIENNLGGNNKVRLVGAKANTMTFHSSAGEPLIIDANWISMEGEREPGDLFTPVYTGTLADGLFMHSNFIMSAAGAAWLTDNNVAKTIQEISLELNNNLSEDDFTNSENREFIAEGFFESKLTLNVPYNATTKGFWAAVAALDLVTLTLTWTNAVKNLIFVVKGRCVTELPEASDLEGAFISLEFDGRTEAFDSSSVTAEVVAVPAP